MWGGNEHSVQTGQNNGIIITGDNNQNISIHYGPTEARLSIPFKPDSLTDNIDSLLIWQSQLTPLIGREKTVAELKQWAETGPRISFKLIHGEGGVGKTRLAFEVAAKLREQGWEAGQLRQVDGSAFRLGENGTLLIIDYPEQQPERVQQLLQAFKEAEEPAAPLRIPLLSRCPQLLDQLGGLVRFLTAEPLPLAPLDRGRTAWSLFEAAWFRICKLRQQSDSPLPIDQTTFSRWLAQHKNHAQPLFILAFALNLVEEPQATTLSGAEIIRRLVVREAERLEREGKAQDIHPLALPLLKGLAAISGGITAQQLKALAEYPSLKALLPDYDSLRHCTIWQEAKQNGKGAGRVTELQPDLLAAALLSRLLNRDDEQPGEWLYATLDASEDIESATSRLGRLMYDTTQVLRLPWPRQALIEAVKDNLPRCRRLERSLSERSLERPLLPLALHVGQVLFDAAEEPGERAGLLINRSNFLAESGDRPGALKAIEQSVGMYKQLAEEDFATYCPDLAKSLNNLSVDLAESGERPRGLVAVKQSVTICERLAKQNFAAYAPDLASGLNNLSVDLAEGGNLGGGLKAVRRAVKIYEELVKKNPATYEPALAGSLSNLSNRLAENNSWNKGLKEIQRAVEIYEKLAEKNPATYKPALAANLNNLSIRLAGCGDRKGGLEISQKAIEIYEELAEENSVAYNPGLAMSLHTLSNRLAENDDPNGGLEAIQRAVEIRQILAEKNSAKYNSELAESLNTQSIRRMENGDRDGGLEASLASVAIYEQLAKKNFTAYPNLALSLYNLSLRLAENDKTTEAINTVQRAIELITPHAINSTYGDWLELMKNNLASYQARKGR